jgi:dihydrofolate reductase
MDSPHKWSFPYWNEEIGKIKTNELLASDALLLGRVTYDAFAESWPGRKDETGFADRFNSIRKYVVSTTLRKTPWNNSVLIKKNIPNEVTLLKQELGKDIVIHGSATLVQSLMEEDLVDLFRLLVYPITRGRGKRLFKNGSEKKLHLTTSRSVGSGVLLLEYEPDRAQARTPVEIRE